MRGLTFAILSAAFAMAAPAHAGTPKEELTIDLHVYSIESEKRFVFVNKRKYREGDTLQEGPYVEQITREGVVLRDNGKQFLLKRQAAPAGSEGAETRVEGLQLSGVNTGYGNSGLYSGEVSNGQPHGYGVFDMGSNRLTGQWRNGVPQGTARIQSPRRPREYRQVTYDNGTLSGSYSLFIDGQLCEIGQMQDGHRVGKWRQNLCPAKQGLWDYGETVYISDDDYCVSQWGDSGSRLETCYRGDIKYRDQYTRGTPPPMSGLAGVAQQILETWAQVEANRGRVQGSTTPGPEVRSVQDGTVNGDANTTQSAVTYASFDCIRIEAPTRTSHQNLYNLCPFDVEVHWIDDRGGNNQSGVRQGGVYPGGATAVRAKACRPTDYMDWKTGLCRDLTPAYSD